MQYDSEFNGRIFVPSNIKIQKQAVIAKFDFRDLIFIGVALGLFGLGFIITSNILQALAKDVINVVDGVEVVEKQQINNMIPLLVGLILGLPVVIAGFKQWNGLKFEEYLQVMFSNKVKASNVRINNSDNIYEVLEKVKKKKVNNDDEFINTYKKLDPISKLVFKITNKDKAKLINKIDKENTKNNISIKDSINTIKNKKVSDIIPKNKIIKFKKKKKINIEDKIIYN